MGPHSRRRLLATMPPAALSATAGCLSDLPGFGPRKRFQLAYVDVINLRTTSHDVVLRISRDGERLIDREYSIGPGDSEDDGQRVEHEWMAEKGLYLVEVETDWGTTVSVSTEDVSDMARGEPDTECVRFIVALRTDKTVGIYPRFFETCP